MIAAPFRSLLPDSLRQLEYDVLIVGAGMVGSTLAAALSHTPLRVGLIEARDLTIGPGPDGRASALALGTMTMLQQIGAWEMMALLGVSPIHRIQVSDGGFQGMAQLRSTDINVDALGYIVENRVTQAGLYRQIQTSDRVQVICPAVVDRIEAHSDAIYARIQPSQDDLDPVILKASLLVGADGSRSRIRELAGVTCSNRPYRQICVVTTVITEQPHQQVAYERFQPSGPFAILPMTDPEHQGQSHRSCVVWTLREQDREWIMGLEDPEFIAAMMPSFGSQLGAIRSVSPRACYQPRCLHSHQYVSNRVALVGDAAHSTHPVGGQGVNMGMRDVALLASLLSEAPDPGSLSLLTHYNQARRLENAGVLFGTDTANRLFSNEWLPLQWSRRLGLVGLGWVPPVKYWIMRQAMGIAFYQPRLHLAQSLPAPSLGSVALHPVGQK